MFRERDALSKLSNHDFTIEYFGTCQDPENLYFITEYCPYGSLGDLIKSWGTLPMELTKIYAAQILLGLEFMHDKNFVHRDLKPANLLINKKK